MTLCRRRLAAGGDNALGQSQPVLDERLEIGRVDGSQFRSTADSHCRDHAIGKRTRTAASLVEKLRSQDRITGKKAFGKREHLLRECCTLRIERAAKIFSPSHRADP